MIATSTAMLQLWDQTLGNDVQGRPRRGETTLGKVTKLVDWTNLTSIKISRSCYRIIAMSNAILNPEIMFWNNNSMLNAMFDFRITILHARKV
jgi:hypothetical protein